MFIRKTLAALPLITACIFVLASACAPIQIITAGSIDSTVKSDVAKTVDQYNQILIHEMGVRLTQEIRIYLAQDTDAYRRIMSDKFHLSKEEAKRWSDHSVGFSTGSGVAMDVSRPSMEYAKYRFETTAHELFHQLQDLLTGGNRSESQRWMTEGTAYLVGVRVCEKLGHGDLDQWFKEYLNYLRGNPKPATVAEVMRANDSEVWLKLEEEDKAPFAVASVMLYSLSKQAPKNFYQGIGEYFIQLGCGKKHATAFSKAFGLSSDLFLDRFSAWYAEELSKPAVPDIAADPGVPSATIAEIKKYFDSSQEFFTASGVTPLKISPRIYLSSNKANSITFLEKDRGLDPDQAREKADQKYFPYYLDFDSVLVNLHDESTRASLLLTSASVFARMYREGTGARRHAEQCTWLYNGSAELLAALIGEKCGYQSLDEQKKTWLAELRKGPPLPVLHELKTTQEWSKFYSKIGRSRLFSLTRLAACCLMEKKGIPSIFTWLRETKELQSAEKAFQKTFGFSSAEFEREFSAYLRGQI